MPIMPSFSGSCAGMLDHIKPEIRAKMKKTLAIGCGTWFYCVLRQGVSVLKQG
jgi:hypothetical protein